jgi:hypothetical protein
MGALDSPVRHQTLSGAPATSPNHYGSGASGRWRLCPPVAPDSPVPNQTGTVQCPMCLWRLLWLLRALFVHCSVVGCPLQSTITLDSRYSAGAPDSPVAHRTVRWIIEEHAGENPRVASLGLYGPGAPDTVRCARPGHTRFLAPLYLKPFFNLILVCVEPLCTCRSYTLEQTS